MSGDTYHGTVRNIFGPDMCSLCQSPCTKIQILFIAQDCLPVERTKSKLLSDIAEQVSRGQYMRPGHSRKSSGDSQDSCRDPLRRAKKRRWNLTKVSFQALYNH